MSIRIMAQVWDAGPEDKSELLVMLALADFANDAGECWPSMVSVGQKARMSERNARRILRKLEADGYIQTAEGGGRHGCNKYLIIPDKMSGRTKCPGGQIVQETRTNRAGNPDIAVSAEPSRTVKNHQKGAREVLLGILSEKVADDFIDHRKAMRKPLTERAAELIVAKLAGCRDPDAVANMSIMNGWQGVFPERERGAPHRAGQPNADRQLDQWEYIAKHGSSAGWAA